MKRDDYLLVHQRAGGKPHPHAQTVTKEKVRMMHKRQANGAQANAHSVQVGLEKNNHMITGKRRRKTSPLAFQRQSYGGSNAEGPPKEVVESRVKIAAERKDVKVQ